MQGKEGSKEGKGKRGRSNKGSTSLNVRGIPKGGLVYACGVRDLEKVLGQQEKHSFAIFSRLIDNIGTSHREGSYFLSPWALLRSGQWRQQAAGLLTSTLCSITIFFFFF